RTSGGCSRNRWGSWRTWRGGEEGPVSRCAVGASARSARQAAHSTQHAARSTRTDTMPLTEAAPDAVARMYAKTLFQLAEEAGGQAAIEETLGELEEILDLARGDAKFSEFLSSRIVPAAARAEALDRIFK